MYASNYTLAAKDPKQQNKVLDVGHFTRYDTIRHDGVRADALQTTWWATSRRADNTTPTLSPELDASTLVAPLRQHFFRVLARCGR